MLMSLTAFRQSEPVAQAILSPSTSVKSTLELTFSLRRPTSFLHSSLRSDKSRRAEVTCWLHLVTWKPVKRKPARGTKDKRAPPPVDEKVYEKRAVFLEGHKSSGWVSGDNNWQHQHGLDFDSDFVEEGQVAHVIGGHGDKEEREGDEEGDDDGDSDDEDYDGYNDYDEGGSDSGSDSDGSGPPSVPHVVKHAHRGKKAHKSEHGLPPNILSRPPEKRSDVFHAKDRHGDLYIPPPLEVMFPEVAGTGMSTLKYRTREAQVPFYEDPYRFGKTEEEIAAMDALQDL